MARAGSGSHPPPSRRHHHPAGRTTTSTTTTNRGNQDQPRGRSGQRTASRCSPRPRRAAATEPAAARPRGQAHPGLLATTTSAAGPRSEMAADSARTQVPIRGQPGTARGVHASTRARTGRHRPLRAIHADLQADHQTTADHRRRLQRGGERICGDLPHRRRTPGGGHQTLPGLRAPVRGGLADGRRRHSPAHPRVRGARRRMVDIATMPGEQFSAQGRWRTHRVARAQAHRQDPTSAQAARGALHHRERDGGSVVGGVASRHLSPQPRLRLQGRTAASLRGLLPAAPRSRRTSSVAAQLPRRNDTHAETRPPGAEVPSMLLATARHARHLARHLLDALWRRDQGDVGGGDGSHTRRDDRAGPRAVHPAVLRVVPRRPDGRPHLQPAVRGPGLLSTAGLGRPTGGGHPPPVGGRRRRGRPHGRAGPRGSVPNGSPRGLG